jgi:hypothetical protein
MDKTINVGSSSIFGLVVVACIAYLNYGTATAVAAYTLFSVMAGLIVIVGLIPIAGIFIYWYVAKAIGITILTYAGLAAGTTLFSAILIGYGIVALIICMLTTFLAIGKIIKWA